VTEADAMQYTVPSMALKVVDRAMQVHGAEGICQDTPLAYMYGSLRTLKYADVSVRL
jgi:acyl-CoA dehydrogenase